jgi:hypothetical protein
VARVATIREDLLKLGNVEDRAYPGLTPETVGSVDPDVLSLDSSVGRKVHVLLQSSSVGEDGVGGLLGAELSVKTSQDGQPAVWLNNGEKPEDERN